MGDLDECAGFEFFSNFDSANLCKVEYVPPNESAVTPSSKGGAVEIPDVEFNIWTKPDCFETEFENLNRTWFYFGIRANASGLVVKLNLVDLNRQAKMYSQGMAPVCRTIPGKTCWERVRDKPTFTINDDIFTLSFKYKTPENIQSITYFAFTYPYSFTELNHMLLSIDNRFSNTQVMCKDDIYYYREVLGYSLEGRRMDLITISSYRNISSEREVRLKNLFPDEKNQRPFRFIGKKVIFISARVHPGETPSSFVFNGILNLLLNRDDPVAVTLRKLYVFKLIPMLNPDGVARGHYRTDTRGVNLNRMYLNPSFTLHPSIYAARALIRYYHYGYEKEDIDFDNVPNIAIENDQDEDDMSSMEDNRPGVANDSKLSKKVSHMTLEENKNEEKDDNVWCCKCKQNIIKLEDTMPGISSLTPTFNHGNPLSLGKSGCRNCGSSKGDGEELKNAEGDYNQNSGLFMYLDMHGHASKKGIFMYGNHFEEYEKNIECMLLPKIMSLNNSNFHFTACNFTERNMYLKDRRDGMSREGSGRVAVLKLTGLIRSYTLECNYNTGRLVNTLPTAIRDGNIKNNLTTHVPPKYNPQVFEEVGKALGASILDLTGNNPYTRLPNSQFHTLTGLRDWLRVHCSSELGDARYTNRFKLRHSSSLHQGKSVRSVVVKTRSATTKSTLRKPCKRSTSVPVDRKENFYETIFPEPGASSIITVPRSRSKIFKKKIEVARKKPSGLRPSSSKSKLQAIKEKQDTPEEASTRPKLHEICFIKSTEGKRMVAKYKPKKDKEEDNLIVEWNPQTNKAQVFAHKSKQNMSPPKPLYPDAGPSRDGVFRVHNFAKSSSLKVKQRNKRPLRRLATNTESSKIDKMKKRKIIKSQA